MGFKSFKNQFEKVQIVENNNNVIPNPVVSVCVQTYQHANYIKECLDGILMQQTNFDVEILLGEDSSTDGTREISIEYAGMYPDRIRLFLHSRENNIKIGLNPTGRFNFLFNLYSSKGKYIAICEGDDYWTDPLKLQKQVDLLEGNSNLIACHHWQNIAVEVEGEFIETESPKEGYYPNSVSKVDAVFANKMRAKTRTLMFKNIIDNNFFPEWFKHVAFGDVPLTFLLGKYGDFGFIDEKMAVYRQTGRGVSLSGLKELGTKKFRVQHSKNWIKIWDYADMHFNYKYHKEATKTVKSYYQTMVENLPMTMVSFFQLLKYTTFDRKVPFHKTREHNLWLVYYYFKSFVFKLKKKLERL